MQKKDYIKNWECFYSQTVLAVAPFLKKNIAGNSEVWASIKERIPAKTGWYKVKTKYDFTMDIALSKTMKGKLVWVIPDESLVTYWRELSQVFDVVNLTFKKTAVIIVKEFGLW